jgi:hypothetical protein
MTLTKKLVFFALAGLCVPIMWLFFYKTDLYHLFIHGENDQIVMNVLLIFWPSSLLLIADPMDNNYSLQFVSVIVNPILYMIVGAIFLAIKKYFWRNKR